MGATLGRKPKLDSENPGSKIGVSTCAMACWISRSTYRRYPQRPLAPARLRDHHPPHRLRAIAAIAQGLADRGPVPARVRGKVLDAHPVDTRRPSVGLHPLPRRRRLSGANDRSIKSSCKAGCVSPRRCLGSPGRVRHQLESFTTPPCLSMFGPSSLQRRRLLRPLLTSVRSRRALLRSALCRCSRSLPRSLAPAGSTPHAWALFNQRTRLVIPAQQLGTATPNRSPRIRT